MLSHFMTSTLSHKLPRGSQPIIYESILDSVAFFFLKVKLTRWHLSVAPKPLRGLTFFREPKDKLFLVVQIAFYHVITNSFPDMFTSLFFCMYLPLYLELSSTRRPTNVPHLKNGGKEASATRSVHFSELQPACEVNSYTCFPSPAPPCCGTWDLSFFCI